MRLSKALYAKACCIVKIGEKLCQSALARMQFGSIAPTSDRYYGASTIVSSYGITMFSNSLILYTAFGENVHIMYILYAGSYREYT